MVRKYTNSLPTVSLCKTCALYEGCAIKENKTPAQVYHCMEYVPTTNSHIRQSLSDAKEQSDKDIKARILALKNSKVPEKDEFIKNAEANVNKSYPVQTKPPFLYNLAIVCTLKIVDKVDDVLYEFENYIREYYPGLRVQRFVTELPADDQAIADIEIDDIPDVETWNVIHVWAKSFFPLSLKSLNS